MSTVEQDTDYEPRYCYICPCGKTVGSRRDPTADPTKIVSKRLHDYDFGFDEVAQSVDFTCLCGRAYDGAGRWVPDSEVPNKEPIVSMHVVKPEIPPHYNPAFGCVVESRKHLEHLQQVHGCEDADNVGKHLIDSNGALPDTPTNAATAHQDMLREGEKAAAAQADLISAHREKWGNDFVDGDDAAVEASGWEEADPTPVPARRSA